MHHNFTPFFEKIKKGEGRLDRLFAFTVSLMTYHAVRRRKRKKINVEGNR